MVAAVIGGDMGVPWLRDAVLESRLQDGGVFGRSRAWRTWEKEPGISQSAPADEDAVGIGALQGLFAASGVRRCRRSRGAGGMWVRAFPDPVPVGLAAIALLFVRPWTEMRLSRRHPR